ncbi:MAG: hypothetical protein COB08_009935 [Rhodobacteraceae bacterium]|nr:hypothetical protein [Paracoccaceae bacterium]
MLLNGVVSGIFLNARIEEDQQQVKTFQSELAVFESEIPEGLENDIQNATIRFDRMLENKDTAEAEVARLTGEIIDNTAQLEKLQDRITTSWLWERTGLSDEETAYSNSTSKSLASTCAPAATCTVFTVPSASA